jgi:hypothetical protein
MVPQLSSADLSRLLSAAEAKLYAALQKQLDDNIVVLHSQCFIRKDRFQDHVDAEADFIVFNPRGGYLVIEVKGGGIAFDPQQGVWSSLDRYGKAHVIKDPFAQAKTEKFAVLEQLQHDGEWRSLGLRIPAGHSVFLPDVDRLAPLVKPDAPLEILGGRMHLEELDRWIAAVNAYWCPATSKHQSLGPRGMAVIERLFCRQIRVRPLIACELAEEEERRITLTAQQGQLLRALRSKRTAAICGGAGTGKTLLAMEKARTMAANGLRTLLLCYNVPLAEHFRRIIGKTDNLLGMNFHQFCEWRITAFHKQTGRDLIKEAEADYPGQDRFGIHYPFALTVAQEAMPEPFDAIIVDEGQDFADEYWMPVTVSLRTGTQSILYVFFDDNQRLYTRTASFPIPLEDTFFLTTNCRNTKNIHELAYRYFAGAEIAPPTMEGAPVQIVAAPSLSAQAKRIHAIVADLIVKEGVRANDVVVLMTGQPKAAYYKALASLPLPRPARWAAEAHAVEGTVLMDTVGRFKGLESPVVCLWVADDVDPRMRPEIPYVGSSRAKSRLYVVGTQQACQSMQTAVNQPG